MSDPKEFFNFRYHKEEELDENKVYLHNHMGLIRAIRLHRYNGVLYTSDPMGIKATTIGLQLWEEVWGCKIYHRRFKLYGRLNKCLPVPNENRFFFFIYWEQGQRNIVNGWVKISEWSGNDILFL